MSNADLAQRLRTLDPRGSFIVEAPAGSGKTELLTQRLLRLLDCVELPEQVLAITFTRKAAAEMRQRVVDTLRAAALQAPDVPAHRLQSVELARAVLRRSERLGWSLIEHTQRLRILTIDALNTSLARQLPLLTGGIVSVRIADSADHLYRLAARRTAENLPDAGPLGAALRLLLETADNSLAKLESWLAGTLPQRDRWLRELERTTAPNLPALVEANVARLHDAGLARLEVLAGEDDTRLLHALLLEWRGPPSTAPARTDAVSGGLLWLQAARLLLTTRGSWRQRFTKREGLGADRAALKKSIEILVARLRERTGLREALGDFADLPGRTLGADQRAVLEGLVPVQKRLLAELKLAFSATESVDHAELALAAQEALGAVDAPSDLLLALDRRIEHILVDEFQDTSHLQWGLIERLTAGWESGDGRSLFLVGDPMQSIYRFRDADVSLFWRAQQQGIGDLRLEPVRLSVNHRSAPAIVDWVNTTFPPLFVPASGQEATGPEFSMAIAGRGPEAGAGVEFTTLHVDDYDEEIARVVEIVAAEEVRRPGQSIGILVRSRTHLAGLRDALARAGLAAHAVEIDNLTDTQTGLDLIALTSALLHAGDRLSWLALLRGPCCGLDWCDLQALVDGAGERTIRELIEDPDRRALLSADGRQRTGWIAERLRRGDSLRAGLSLGAWIRECWLLIDGPACLDNPGELRLAEGYFRELDAFARGGDLDDPARLTEWFARPSVGAVAGRSGIELMTIHRAKGLEFDTVVLPGLSRKPRGSDLKLLLTQDIILSSGERIALLAGAVAGDDPLVSYLRMVARAEELQERSRLLYVAATRARSRLYLLAGLKKRHARPHRDSLLALLAPGTAVADAVDSGDSGEATNGDSHDEKAAATEFCAVPLERLSLAEDVPWPPPAGEGGDAARRTRPEFEWAHPASVQVGTLIHRELQRLCELAVAAGRPVAPQISVASFRRELALLGIETEDLDTAAERVREALERVWSDPVGRRILHPWPEAWSELRMSWRGRDRIEHLQIDRSFVDDSGVRWIVDYKSGRHLGADVEAFLESESERYRAQLERYAEAVAASDSRPIRVALYFPLLQRLKDWVPAAAIGR